VCVCVCAATLYEALAIMTRKVCAIMRVCVCAATLYEALADMTRKVCAIMRVCVCCFSV
jgi:hypothetical protein